MVDTDELHRQAIARGERLYRDPRTSLWVMTRLAHLERGSCCGSGCRHCPWSAAAEGEPGPSPTDAGTHSPAKS